MRENIKEDIIKKNLVLKENKNINKIFVYEKSIRTLQPTAGNQRIRYKAVKIHTL